jgi:endonuclease IV
MKIGIKVFPHNITYIKEMVEHSDFIEVMALKESDFSGLKDYDIPYVIHNMHSCWGVNFANPEKSEFNKSTLNFALQLADKINAKTIIAHPGLIENKECTNQSAIKFFNQFPDERIVIENMPYYSDKIVEMGKSFSEMKEILDGTKKKMCLDFGHASASAVGLKQDQMTLIKQFIALKPKHFHFCDGIFDKPRDAHMNIGDGNYPLEEFKKLIPNDAWVTLETPHGAKKQINDINFLKR